MATDAEVWRGIVAEVARRSGFSVPETRLSELGGVLDASAQSLAIGDATACARALVAGRLDRVRLAAMVSHLGLDDAPHESVELLATAPEATRNVGARHSLDQRSRPLSEAVPAVGPAIDVIAARSEPGELAPRDAGMAREPCGQSDALADREPEGVEKGTAGAGAADPVEWAGQLPHTPSPCIAVFDDAGMVVAASEEWRAFWDALPAHRDAPSSARHLLKALRSIGCPATEVGAFSSGLEDVVAGRRTQFAIECGSASPPRSLLLRLQRFPLDRRACTLLILEDVTGHRRRAAQVASARQRLASTLERITDGFLTLDRRWRFTYVNREAERILRRDRTEMLGRNLWQLFAHIVGTEFERQYRGAMEDRKPRHFEAYSSALDIWVDVHAYPSDEGLAVYFRDATGRRRAELALQQSEESLRLATTAAGLGTWHWNSGDGQLVVSEQTRILFGVPADAHVTRGTLFQCIHPEDRMPSIAALQAAVENDNELHADFRVVRPDGSIRWMASFGRGYHGAAGGAVRVEGVVLDITSRKRAEEELRELNEQLEQRVAQRTRELVEATRQAEAANEAKSVFLATMSHEIRTPMNGIVGMVDVLSHGRLSEHQGEAVRTIRDSAFALLRLIDDVLDFSKIEAGKLELERTQVPLADIAESVCETLSPLADLKGVDVFLFVTPYGPAHVWSDPVRLRQILYNLVGNAIKFSGGRPARRGRVEVRIEIASENPFRVRMRVTDNGIGMSDEVQRELFQSFRQAEISTTRRFGGSGLGLAICKRLADLAGGTIGVESTPGKGATFTVELPLEPVLEPPAPLQPSLEGVDYVIVTRSYVNAQDLKIYLDCAGATTHMVDGAPEALEACGRLAAPVVVHSLPDDVMRPRWLSLFAHLPHVRHLILSRGRRRVGRVAGPNVVTIDGNALRRRALLHAAAAAAGRASVPGLPTGADPEDVFEAPAAPTVAEARARGQLILVAEDDSTNQKVLLRQLELLGYAAEVAPDGVEALSLWRKGGYALLITDLHMPNLDGYGLIAAIRREEADDERMPVVALTANAVRGEAARALSAGLNEYLTKPVQLAVLRKVLEKLLSPAEAASSPGASGGTGQALLDIDILTRLVGNAPGAVAEMLDDYARSLNATLPALHDALLAGDLGEVGRVAHRLKSSSRAIGALPMGDLCAELENVCRMCDRAAAAYLMTHFEATAMELLSQIRRSAEGGE